MHTLGYGDDLTLLDDGNEAGVVKSTTRVTKIAVGSRERADMEVKTKKAKVVYIRPQDPVSVTTSRESM